MFSSLFTTYGAVTPPPISRQDYISDIDSQNDLDITNLLDITPTLPIRNLEQKQSNQSNQFRTEGQEPIYASLAKTVNDPFIFNQDIKKPLTTRSSNGKFNNKTDFIKALNTGYRKALSKEGLDPNYSYILTAQAALESNWGKNIAGNFNFGGIKATGTQKGSYKTTKEYDPSKGYYTTKDKFRDFKSIDDYCEARVKLLSNKRYNVFNQFTSDNPQQIITHVVRKGYATAPIGTYVPSVMNAYKTVINTLTL